MRYLDLFRAQVKRLVIRNRQGEGRCPFHDDARASFSVNLESGLWKCHAGGCGLQGNAKQFAERVGAPFSDDAGSGKHGGARQIVATYPYHDANGRLLFEVVRYLPKGFKQRRPDGHGGWIWNLDGVRRVLYRLPELLKGADPVLIPEGEKDVDNLRRMSFTATTNPEGAGKWRAEYAEALEGRAVVLIPDSDRPGRDHMDAVARSLAPVAASVHWLALPDLPEKGDVSDWFAQGHTAEKLRGLIAAAPTWAEVQAGARDEDRAPEVMAREGGEGPVLIRLAEVCPEPVTWLWPGRVPRGKLTMIVGDPGIGKSYVLLDLISRVTVGAPWPDGGAAPGGPAVLLTAEDGLADTVRPRVDVMGGDPKQVVILAGIGKGADTPVRLPHLGRDLAHLERVIEEEKPVLVGIDVVNAYLGDTDSYKDSEVRGILTPLAKLAERAGVAVVGIMHLNKNEQRKVLYRGMGGLGFVAAPRAVFAVAPDPEDKGRGLLLPLKLNIGPTPPGLAFRLVPTRHGGGFEVARVAWDTGPVTVDAETALGPSETPEDRGAAQDAAAFLRDLLAAGPVASEDVKRQARAAGIAERTLFRAKAKVGAESYRTGGVGADGRWFWRLRMPLPPKVANISTVADMAILGGGGNLSGAAGPLRALPEVDP